MCLTRNLIMRIETNFKEDLFKEELVEKYIFVLTPNLCKMTFSGCRCAAFYDRSNDYSHKALNLTCISSKQHLGIASIPANLQPMCTASVHT